jgi:uncharacterized protein YkwD
LFGFTTTAKLIGAVVAALFVAALISSTAMASPVEEQRLVGLVNEKRRAVGVRPLKLNKRVRTAARAHSRDMIDRNYFGHISATGSLNVTDRLRHAGLTGWSSAGENLAGARSAEVAFDLWLNSPGHLKNMLEPAYTHVGIGVIAGGQYGSMITMNLVERPVVQKPIKRPSTMTPKQARLVHQRLNAIRRRVEVLKTDDRARAKRLDKMAKITTRLKNSGPSDPAYTKRVNKMDRLAGLLRASGPNHPNYAKRLNNLGRVAANLQGAGF